MAVDFQMHVALSDQDIKDYKIAHADTIGSKYENINLNMTVEEAELHRQCILESFMRLDSRPGIHLGTLSWLKFGLTGDDQYTPGALVQISELIGEDFPIIDEELIEKIEHILDTVPNLTTYFVIGSEPVVKFMRKYIGKRVYTLTV